MRSVIGWIVVAVCLLLVKLPASILGLVLVPFTDAQRNPVWGNREQPESPSWHMDWAPDWLANYVWRAIRNPANNLRFWIDEPNLHFTLPNPDEIVRTQGKRSATRYVDGWLPEYWHLRRLKSGKLFEFRVGWKYSGVPGFAPTIQLRWEDG